MYFESQMYIKFAQCRNSYQISCVRNIISLWLKFITIFKILNYQALLEQDKLSNLDICIVKILLPQDM